MYSYTLTRQCVENNLQCVEIYLLFEKNKKELKTPLNLFLFNHPIINRITNFS